MLDALYPLASHEHHLRRRTVAWLRCHRQQPAEMLKERDCGSHAPFSHGVSNYAVRDALA